jgi:hypothetical protein
MGCGKMQQQLLVTLLLFLLYKKSILKKLEGAMGFVCLSFSALVRFCNLGFVASEGNVCFLFCLMLCAFFECVVTSVKCPMSLNEDEAAVRAFPLSSMS